jgi:hypothetical protein
MKLTVGQKFCFKQMITVNRCIMLVQHADDAKSYARIHERSFYRFQLLRECAFSMGILLQVIRDNASYVPENCLYLFNFVNYYASYFEFVKFRRKSIRESLLCNPAGDCIYGLKFL